MAFEWSLYLQLPRLRLQLLGRAAWATALEGRLWSN
jgi:hypothetical protein